MMTMPLFALQNRKDQTFLLNKHGVPYTYSSREKIELAIVRGFTTWNNLNIKDFNIVEVVIQRRMP